MAALVLEIRLALGIAPLARLAVCVALVESEKLRGMRSTLKTPLVGIQYGIQPYEYKRK